MHPFFLFRTSKTHVRLNVLISLVLIEGKGLFVVHDRCFPRDESSCLPPTLCAAEGQQLREKPFQDEKCLNESVKSDRSICQVPLSVPLSVSVCQICFVSFRLIQPVCQSVESQSFSQSPTLLSYCPSISMSFCFCQFLPNYQSVCQSVESQSFSQSDFSVILSVNQLVDL